MQLRDLPDDVLRLVLKASFTASGGMAATLKTNLPLLAVCRRWRHLVLAAVYSHVAIRYGGRPRYRSSPDDGHANNADGEPDDAEITTNLDLVASVGCVQMVNRVEIVVHYKLNPFPGLGAAIQLMHTAAEEWRGVRQLDISFSQSDHTLAHGINVADYEPDIAQTAAALIGTMPRVCRVSFDGIFVNPIIWKLDGQLAVHYSDQLESLISDHPITVPPDHTFKHLKKAFIGAYGGGSSYQYPRVDPANLVLLSLASWPSDHSWAPFSADDGSEAIEFPNLKKLSVMYWPVDAVYGVEARRRDDRPWKLHFPKLDMLRVSCIQDRCPLLEYAVLPSRMGEISIEATGPLLVRVAERGLPVSRCLEVVAKGDSIGGPAALAAANRILEGARESKERALRVKVRSPTVVPESITCTSLTALSLYVNTSVDTMLGLIQMLPDLVSLEIRCLTLSDMQEDISAPGPDEECMVEPLGSNIKEININVSPNEPASEMLVPVAKHLLLRIPTLARVCSSAILEEPIAEFVDAYSKRYPHLPGIKYMLKNKSA